MTTAMLFASVAPLMQQLFPQVPLIEQVHRTPTLIFGVLECSLAAAFLALWRAAQDYRVFRTLGFFYAIVGVEQFLQYFGGFTPTEWSLRALAVGVLVAAAGEAMQVTHRGWTRLFWPIYLFGASPHGFLPWPGSTICLQSSLRLPSGFSSFWASVAAIDVIAWWLPPLLFTSSSA